MTTTVTGLATRALSMNSLDDLSTTVGLALMGVLVLLLFVRELAPILRGGDAPRETRVLDMALAPLLIVFTIIVFARLAELIA